MSVELQEPIMTPEALAANCTHEGGVFGTTRFLKNVMGLWLLQECQRSFTRNGQVIDYDRLLLKHIRLKLASLPGFFLLLTKTKTESIWSA